MARAWLRAYLTDAAAAANPSPMPYEPQRAWTWRLRAEMLRERAARSKDLRSRDNFLALADVWEQKATAAETPPARPRPKSGDEA